MESEKSRRRLSQPVRQALQDHQAKVMTAKPASCPSSISFAPGATKSVRDQKEAGARCKRVRSNRTPSVPQDHPSDASRTRWPLLQTFDVFVRVWQVERISLSHTGETNDPPPPIPVVVDRVVDRKSQSQLHLQSCSPWIHFFTAQQLYLQTSASEQYRDSRSILQRGLDSCTTFHVFFETPSGCCYRLLDKLLCVGLEDLHLIRDTKEPYFVFVKTDSEEAKKFRDVKRAVQTDQDYELL